MADLGVEVKALIDAAPLALTAVYRQGWVPDDAQFPYASFLDPVSDAPALSGDARTLARRRLVQVDVWQDEATEDDDLVDGIVAALDGAVTSTGVRLRVLDVSQVPGPEEDEDVVHHAITVSGARVL